MALHVAFTQSGFKISHWYVLPGRYLKPPLPSSKTLRSMLYGLVEFCAVAGWLGVTVEQASKGAPVGKEMTGTTVETSNNTAATRGLMIECVLHLHNTIRIKKVMTSWNFGKSSTTT